MVVFNEITALASVTESLLSTSIKWGQRKQENALEFRKEQMMLLQELTKSGIDPRLFDLMLTTELDRKLKARFGVAFYVATVIFTAASFLIVVLNVIFKWSVSDVAITGLIIETPLQFIGLLYIIARNLFPQSKISSTEDKKPPKPKPKQTLPKG
jgi:hypothetical protein